MKHYFIIILLFISINLISQTYKPFDFENGVWLVSGGSFGDAPVYTNSQYFCDGDTIINDVKYFKMMEYVLISPSIGPPVDPVLNYVGAIRNVENRQIEMYRKDATSASIIYDFNLNIGDTLTTGYGSHDEPLIIQSIDSIAFCGIYHKRYNLNDSSHVNQALIEGIGFSSGLINPLFFQFEAESKLECYRLKDDSCGGCKLLLANSSVEIQYANISPNPSNGIFKINIDEEIDNLSIFDQMGRKIFYDFQKNDKEINLLSNGSGIYLIRIKTKDLKLYSGKVVIQ